MINVSALRQVLYPLKGPFRLEKYFFRFYRPSVVQNWRLQKNLEKFLFRAERSLLDIFFEKKIRPRC